MNSAQLLFPLVLLATPVLGQDFKYHAPGTLTTPAAGHGHAGRVIYAPDILFPVKLAEDEKAVVNSQVYSPGGMSGGPGGQCSPVNYNMPWSDVYCEKRTWNMPLCPTGKGHQGVDIRPATCGDVKSAVVAVENGTVIDTDAHVSMIKLRGDSGRVYRYLHLAPASFLVTEGKRVTKGDPLGKISNLMNGDHQTTYHLHFDILARVESPSGAAILFVPPYSSLVAAYRRLKNIPPADSNGILNKDPDHELP